MKIFSQINTESFIFEKDVEFLVMKVCRLHKAQILPLVSLNAFGDLFLSTEDGPTSEYQR